MADIDSSLPVKIQDPNTPSNAVAVDAAGKIVVKLDDSAGNGLTSTTEGAHQALDVNVVATVGGVADESAFTLGTSDETPVGGVFNDSAPVLTSGVTAAARITGYRAVHTNLRDAAGNQLLGQKVSADSLPVVIASDQSRINVSDEANGPVAPGTAAAVAELVAGQYNSTLPTLTNGQQAAVQVSSSGELLIAQPTATSLNATVVQPTASNLNATVAQGAAAALSGAWPMEITDGTHGPTAVKAASTAAAATDPSLVVALSPNSPVPAGTNNIGKVSIQDSSGAVISNTNPLPVSISEAVPGTPIYSFTDNSAVAIGGSAFASYTVTNAKTLALYQVLVAGSGKIKAVLQSASLVLTTTGDTTSGSNQLTNLASTVGIATGQLITGPGIPIGTTVSSIASNTVTMSNNAYATGTGVSVNFYGSLVNLGTFFNSVANPNIDINFSNASPYKLLGTGSAVMLLSMANYDYAAQDIYSTIIGLEQ